MRALLYERVSVARDGADARSVAEQNKDNTAACDERGWTIAGRYADPGRSASRFARKYRDEWFRLVGAVRARQGDVVVLWEPSRGARELEQWSAFLNACRDTSTKVYVTSHDHLYDIADGRAWKALAGDGVDAAYQSEETSKRVLRALRASAVAGRPHGPCPYGYKRTYDPDTGMVNGQVPVPEQAAIVTEIIGRIARREAMTPVARDLEDRQVPTPAGGPWTSDRIRRIASNPAYIGKRSHNGDLTGAIWPGIVAEDVFWAAKAALDDIERTSPFRRPGAAKYLLSNLATCGRCGSWMYGTPHKESWIATSYTCRRSCLGIRADWLDDYVTGLLCGRYERGSAYWDGLGAGDSAKAAEARARAGEKRAELAEFRALAAAGKVSPLSFAQIEPGLLALIAEAEAEAEAAAVPASVARFRDKTRDEARVLFEEGMTLAERKHHLRQAFAEIAVLAAGRRGVVREFRPERVRWSWRKPGS